MDKRIEEFVHFVESRRKKLETDSADVMHMALGIAGEAGELVDVVKKHLIYEQALHLTNFREELGDLLFYIQGAHNIFGWSLAETMQRNMDKLTKRYPDGYSNEAAAARADKEGGES